MVRTLAVFLGIFGIVCRGIAICHIILGPAAIPGSVPVNSIMDSEDRFYATLFFGFGAAMMWCALDISRRSAPMLVLMAVFFAGGVARLISIAQVGLPSPFFQLMTGLELLIPPVCWLWRRVALQRPLAGLGQAG